MDYTSVFHLSPVPIAPQDSSKRSSKLLVGQSVAERIQRAVQVAQPIGHVVGDIRYATERRRFHFRRCLQHFSLLRQLIVASHSRIEQRDQVTRRRGTGDARCVGRRRIDHRGRRRHGRRFVWGAESVEQGQDVPRCPAENEGAEYDGYRAQRLAGSVLVLGGISNKDLYRQTI